MAEALVDQYPRDSFYITAKMPLWRVKSLDDAKFIFQKQLKNLHVDYIDFYLLHAMNADYWEIAQKVDIISFLDDLKKRGIIKRVGFSFHGSYETLESMLNAYKWDFCQLQLNYYDWNPQQSKEKYELCESMNIPVIVMEPLGGGRLVKLTPEAHSILKSEGVNPVLLAFSFLKKLKNVAVVLSGAITLEQFQENVSFMDAELSDFQTKSLIERVNASIVETNAIPCTACHYCVKDCPRRIDIPSCFQKYNDYKMGIIPGQYKTFGDFYYDCIPVEQRADRCITCRKCAKLCPQGIDVPTQLQKVQQTADEFMIGCEKDEILKLCQGDKVIVCFGAGGKGKYFYDILKRWGLEIDYYSDNSSNSWGKEVNGVEIISPERLYLMREKAIVLIASNYYAEITEQLEDNKVEYVKRWSK